MILDGIADDEQKSIKHGLYLYTAKWRAGAWISYIIHNTILGFLTPCMNVYI